MPIVKKDGGSPSGRSTVLFFQIRDLIDYAIVTSGFR